MEWIPSPDLSPAGHLEILDLCEHAYGEPMASYLADIGPGTHLLGRIAGRLVSHLLVVPRQLDLGAGAPLETAYLELVATRPGYQRRGYAGALLRALPALVGSFSVAALSPVDSGFYARFGWERWRGPLAVRTPGGLVSTPEEEIMILRLPRTPAGLDLDGPASIEWRPGEVW